MGRIAFIIVMVFAVLSIALPFALSTCDGGVFCMASTGHGTDTDTCPSHDDAHFSLFTQFGTCTPQQSMSWTLIFSAAFGFTALWTIMRRFARSLLGVDTFLLDALNAPGALMHMKPFDPLRSAFARGITNARKNVHAFSA